MNFMENTCTGWCKDLPGYGLWFIFLAAIVLFVICVYTVWCVIQHYKFKTSMDNEREAYHNEVTVEEGKH